jgi:DNA-binding NarL/FixJ family response regulator
VPTRQTARRRELLLQTMARCLIRMAEAPDIEGAVDSLVAFLEGLPLTWHAVDVFADGRHHTRIASFRCPRGLSAFVTRLGFAARPDGTYHGSFAASTLLLVKASTTGDRDRCLVCALGLPKDSTLNEGAVFACIAGVIHTALSRVLAFDRQARTDAALRMLVEQDADFVVIVDANGNAVQLHSPSADESVPSVLLSAAAQAARRRTAAAQTATMTVADQVYDATTRWITTAPKLAGKYAVVRLKRRRAAPLAVVEQLKNYGLSRRESQIAELVFSGKTNRLIADTLFISLDTVKTHCRHIFGKLGITRRTEFLRVIGQAGTATVESAGAEAPLAEAHDH